MSIKKTILMLFINYILIIVWLALFRLEVLSALVMLPLTILAITLNYLLLDGKNEVFFWCMNLLGSTIVGIALSTYMYVHYIGTGNFNLVYMIMEMLTFAAIILIAALVAGRMNAKRVKHKRPAKRRRQYYTLDDDYETYEPKDRLSIDAYRQAESIIEEAEDEAIEETHEKPEAKFRMVVKGRDN